MNWCHIGVFSKLSTDVTLKGKNNAAAVDCLFRHEMFFHRSKHVGRYTLHVRVATRTSTDENIVRSENIGSAWGCSEHMWGKLCGLRFKVLTVQ